MTTIRENMPDDAAGFRDLCLSFDSVATFVVYEPGERTVTVDHLRMTRDGER